MRPLRPHSRANATANATGTPFTRKRITTIAAAATAVAIIITMFPLGSAAKIGEAIERNRIERLNATITNIYTTAYQQDADATLIANRDKATATLDDPFTAVNPYGTNTTSMYVYFTTSEAASVSYTVHAEGTRISPQPPTRARTTPPPMSSSCSVLFQGRPTPSR